MKLESLGQRLRLARKAQYPKDDLGAFALRLGVSRATYQKMEKGDLSVTLGKYYKAAQFLELEHTFNTVFEKPESLFDDF